MKINKLSLGEREEISRLLSQGFPYSHIARMIGRHRSTIQREVSRNQADNRSYRAYHSQLNYQRRKRNTGRRKILETNHELRAIVLKWLKQKWSPNQIAERLKMEYPDRNNMRISPETIYSYIYVHPKETLRREMIGSLRRQHKRRRKKKGENFQETRGRIPFMTSIDERPEEINNRAIPGHWEGDLIIGTGKRSALGTLTERNTRITLLVRLADTDAATVRRSFARIIKRIPADLRLSLTYDQGREMKQHQLLTKETKIKVYFAHKSSPWERGTNENTNGLIRQYFPKSTDFNLVSARQIKNVQNSLNGRPRKCLGYKKPIEVFNQLLR